MFQISFFFSRYVNNFFNPSPLPKIISSFVRIIQVRCTSASNKNTTICELNCGHLVLKKLNVFCAAISDIQNTREYKMHTCNHIALFIWPVNCCILSVRAYRVETGDKHKMEVCGSRFPSGYPQEGRLCGKCQLRYSDIWDHTSRSQCY
jgi:hypothetical protein